MSLVYGWTEQSEACWGIESRPLSGDEVVEGVGVDGRLEGILREGEWFGSFSAAKRAAIAVWKRRVNVARVALRSIRSLKGGKR